MRRSLVVAALVVTLSLATAPRGASGGALTDGPIGFSSFPALSDTNVAPLRVIDPSTSAVSTLLGTKTNVDVDFTADGSMMVLARGGPNGFSIFTANWDGTGLLRITDGGSNAFDSSPSWSPDELQIVFQRCKNRCRLWVMDDDGSNLQRVTDTTKVSELNPDWGSNDRIAYVHSGTKKHGIATIDPDGTDRAMLTTKLDDNPAWSPDALSIAFDRFKAAEGTNPIMRMRNDGSVVLQLTGGKKFDAMPAFSPTGGDIVFARGQSPLGADPVMNLWTMDIDGNARVQITDTDRKSELFPAWSRECLVC